MVRRPVDRELVRAAVEAVDDAGGYAVCDSADRLADILGSAASVGGWSGKGEENVVVCDGEGVEDGTLGEECYG